MKRSLLLMLAIFVLFSRQSLAAQILVRSLDEPSQSSYLSTSQKAYTADDWAYKQIYTANGWVYQFKADGITGYPYEIYLPNENRPDQYRIHSNYTKNTDACASCHSTHTAVGSSLLQWYSIYETCMSCHDGTVTTTYDVEDGVVPHAPADKQFTSGGAFGTGRERSLSYHNVTGGVLIGAAPGAVPEGDNHIGTKNDMPLGCESCHSPHGMGGNARILNPDPNGVQTQKEGRFKKYSLTEIGTESISDIVYVVYAAYPKINNVISTVYDPYYMLKGYPYPLLIYSDSKQYDVKIDNSNGYTKVKIEQNSISDGVYADFIPSLRVRMNISNYLGYGVNGASVQELVYYRDGTADFCSACHSNYGKDSTSTAKHHPVEEKVDGAPHVSLSESTLYDSLLKYKLEEGGYMVCLTCHVAHGVSGDYWQKVAGYSDQDAYEYAGSSALKRLPNSGICLGCHPKDKENQGYASNTGQTSYTEEVDVFDASINQPLGVSNFVGLNATNCSSNYCHKPIVEKWKTTSHSSTLRLTSPAFGKADFSSETGKSVEDIIYVIGNNSYQRFIYKDTISGNLSVTPNAYNLTTGDWIPKASINDFVNKCAGCHVTGLNLEAKSWADNGVTCEACHGPASQHLLVQSSQNITNPRYLSMEDQTDVCAQCHALGESITNTGIYFPVNFTLNQNELNSVDHDTYALSSKFNIYKISDAPGNFYATQNNLTGYTTYDSVYPAQEFNDFVQSKHYASKAMSCITCHSSHEKNNKGTMLKGTFEQICGACHDTSFRLNEVMPKRITYTDQASDNLRVHTFSKMHSTNPNVLGNQIVIH